MQRMEHEADHSDTWFARNYPDLNGRPVAYFCAEFGLHNSAPIYSGGRPSSRSLLGRTIAVSFLPRSTQTKHAL